MVLKEGARHPAAGALRPPPCELSSMLRAVAHLSIKLFCVGMLCGFFFFLLLLLLRQAKIRMDILHECEKRIPGFPIVLHGASSVPKAIVDQVMF